VWRCRIPTGEVGRCRTRANIGGRLFSLVYGAVASLSINPIEKKPVYHYLPGTRWLSVGTFGCNFLCPGCQNWGLAHADPRISLESAQFTSPEDLVERASLASCVGISWTFNEPAVWLEYVVQGANLARTRGLRTNVVTNGSFSADALDMLAPCLDVYRVDIKGFTAEAYRLLTGRDCLPDVLDSTRRARRHWGLHVEVVTNVTPGVNDDPEELRSLASWIRDELGQEIPWHLTRFHPTHQLSDVPLTPVGQLEEARAAAMAAGLRYVYLGNVPGHEGENTWCPSCGELLIARDTLLVMRNRMVDGKCPGCGEVISGLFVDDGGHPL
jgi:pyruvate formate lyase activating enzyme